MTPLYVLLFFGFLGGQVFSLTFNVGIRVALLDLVVVLVTAFHATRMKGKLLNFWGKAVGPFIGVALVSLVLSSLRLSPSEVFVSMLYLVRFVLYSLMVFVTYKKEVATLKLLWFCGIGLAFVGLVQYYIYPNLRNLAHLGWDPHQFRVFSTLLDPNFTGILLVLFLLLHTTLSDLVSGISKRVGLWAGIVSLLLTYSRGSWVAGFAALFARAVARKRFQEVFLWIVAFFMMLPVLPRPGGEGVNLFRILSIESRLKDSGEAVRVWQSAPIFGVGFNTLRFVTGDTNIVEGTESLSHSGAGYHNSWLFILATTGIAGLLAYTWMWWSILGKLKFNNPLRLVVFISLFAVFVHSLFDNSLFFPPVMFWLWCLVGVILRTSEVKTRVET